MIQRPLNVRYLLPVIGTSTASFAVCAAMAVLLFREQAASAEALRENVGSYRAAADLEESLTDLIALVRDRAERVAVLHDRIRRHVDESLRFADRPDEAALASRVEASFGQYLAAWEARPPGGPEHDPAVRDALAVLEGDTLKRCQELRTYNAARISAAEERHRATLRGLAWGLAAVGGLAAGAGTLLGYGVTRGLTRSIQSLQIRVRGAAGMLGQDLPPIELDGAGTLTHLDQQVRDLVGRIEEVVAKLQQREREVLRAEQLAAVGQLAAGMAHEIRNPLTSIKMLVQAAGEDGPGGLSAEDLAVIEREVRRVERSLQTFLDFARPPTPAKSAVDLTGVVERTLELIRGRAAKQHVGLAFEPADGPVVVDADPGQVQQVLVNLTLNALDAMPGGGRLGVSLRADGGWAEVVVRDTGPGIPLDVRGKLFRPFVSTKDTGLGLGLVISRRIVADHGGTIRGENLPSGGAYFTVRLPVYAGGKDEG